MKIQNQLPIQRPTGDQDKRIMEAAKMYEQQFMQEMHNAMKKTITHAEKPSMASEIFKGQLDQQHMQQWSENGGIGLAEVIYQQIQDRYFTKQLPKPQGPLPVSPKMAIPQSDDKAINFKLESQEPSGSSGQDLSSVTNPWDGTVKTASRVGNINLLTITHKDGLSSRLAFAGPLSSLKEGDQVSAGQVVGQLGAGESQVQWRISG